MKQQLYDYYQRDINDCISYLKSFNSEIQFQDNLTKLIKYIHELEEIIFGYTE